MKKSALIAGILVITATVGLFVYVLIVRKASDQAPTVPASSLPIGTHTVVGSLVEPVETTVIPPPSSTSSASTTQVTTPELKVVAKDRLTLLSTGEVAGAVFIGTGTVRYMSRGEGSIVDVSIDGVVRSMINTRYSGVISSVFSTDGTRVLARINDAGDTRFLIGVIAQNARGQQELRGSLLPFGTVDAAFADTHGNVRYVLSVPRGGEVHVYAPTTRSDTVEQLIPFSRVRILGSGSATYIATEPATDMHGAVYRYTDTGLIPVLRGGRGLTAFTYSGGLIATMYRDTILGSWIMSSDREEKLPNLIKTDACAVQPQTGTILCARPNIFPEQDYPDAWYTGESTHTDAIYILDPATQALRPVAYPPTEVGRSLDIRSIVAHPTLDNYALLLDKNSGGLWLFTNDVDAQ